MEEGGDGPSVSDGFGTGYRPGTLKPNKSGKLSIVVVCLVLIGIVLYVFVKGSS